MAEGGVRERGGAGAEAEAGVGAGAGDWGGRTTTTTTTTTGVAPCMPSSTHHRINGNASGAPWTGMALNRRQEVDASPSRWSGCPTSHVLGGEKTPRILGVGIQSIAPCSQLFF